jgi:hypothetical protein
MFTFKEEDMTGTNPKFDVIDQDGVGWRVKMGLESRPETAASRLVWAVGYFACRCCTWRKCNGCAAGEIWSRRKATCMTSV